MREQSKPSTLMAFLNADFRNFQGIPAVNENPDNAILMFTYAKLLEACGGAFNKGSLRILFEWLNI